ncbi:uncharacterized protein LOC144090555 isoform X2 [Stigmatopora argus]
MLLDGSRRCRRTTLPDSKSSLILGKRSLTGRRSSWDRCTSPPPSSCQMHWTTWKRREEEKNGVQPDLASPRNSRGFELCPRHSADVDEGECQNNVTMRLWWECQPPPTISSSFGCLSPATS